MTPTASGRFSGTEPNDAQHTNIEFRYTCKDEQRSIDIYVHDSNVSSSFCGDGANTNRIRHRPTPAQLNVALGVCGAMHFPASFSVLGVLPAEMKRPFSYSVLRSSSKYEALPSSLVTYLYKGKLGHREEAGRTATQSISHRRVANSSPQHFVSGSRSIEFTLGFVHMHYISRG
jgi:hypothetical protein